MIELNMWQIVLDFDFINKQGFCTDLAFKFSFQNAREKKYNFGQIHILRYPWGN